MSSINIADSAGMHDSVNGKKTSIADQIKMRMSGGPTKTKIIIRDHNTGEILGEVSNKILVPGSIITACNQFGLHYPFIEFPTYNEPYPNGIGLDNSVEAWSVDPPDNPIITCLWCAGRDGFATSPNEVYVVNNTDRIKPNDLLAFKYVDSADDGEVDRDVYFGRKYNSTTDKVAYYFKKFDTEPTLHINYIDGTEVDRTMWDVPTDLSVEVYMEMKLSVTKDDFRDYFREVLGMDNADISTISLVTAWYREFEEDGETYKYYQDILPFSKFNFKAEELVDLTRALDFNYQIFY